MNQVSPAPYHLNEIKGQRDRYGVHESMTLNPMWTRAVGPNEDSMPEADANVSSDIESVIKPTGSTYPWIQRDRCRCILFLHDLGRKTSRSSVFVKDLALQNQCRRGLDPRVGFSATYPDSLFSNNGARRDGIY